MTWHDLIKRLKGSSTIDAAQQKQMDETTKQRRHIEITSKSLQEVNLSIPQAVSLISNTLEYVKDYRTDEQLQEMLETARKLSVELDIEPKFEKKRGRTKKRIFVYESQKEPMTKEDNFKMNFFNSILDYAIGSLQDRFEILMQQNNQFNFLYSLNAKGITEDELLKRCMDLEKLLSCNKLKDVSGTDLFEEIKYLRNHYKGNYSPRNILDFICSNNLNAALGNFFVSLRILLTLPVSVATAERSFSKMKLIKMYICSTMTQDRMDGLAILSIEQAIAKESDLEDMIKSFAIVKARKVKL
ncbi:zinc finger MYM-type protein 1-like [Hydra vulgaris]|uniref:Zinc finger MYM-type protein 1-like n=1 Tax=Hydra vulgaris TaxID=6087 RepID=A0ABM4B2C2_HYDVU